jgi:endonuclease/exonuclease/phosphatase family metal-dependent hydrolase
VYGRARVRVLTWNLFHGRSVPPSGRQLFSEFAGMLRAWEWDVALLQEVPPWWPSKLAAACEADERTVLTSRNWLLPLRRAISARNPDILKSNGGGSNAILVRGDAIVDHRTLELTRVPERRMAHGVRLAGGTWVANLHATTRSNSKDVPRNWNESRLAAETARAWAAGAPLIFGGDLNIRGTPELPELTRVGGHYVDHVFVGSGLRGSGRPQVLQRGTLSDHDPILVEVSVSR